MLESYLYLFIFLSLSLSILRSSPWRSLSHTHTHSLTHTHSKVVHQDVPALYDKVRRLPADRGRAGPEEAGPGQSGKHRITFGRGDLGVCPLGGSTGARECLVSNWRGVPQGSPQGQTLRALLLRGTSILH